MIAAAIIGNRISQLLINCVENTTIHAIIHTYKKKETEPERERVLLISMNDCIVIDNKHFMKFFEK